MGNNVLQDNFGWRERAQLQKLFFQTVSAQIKLDQSGSKDDAHRKFYGQIGNKTFTEPFFKSTIDLVFASYVSRFKGGIVPDSLSETEVLELNEFVSSRYLLVHDVIKGIASKVRNPLGTELTEQQTLALATETLKLSLDPAHTIDIRVGIGGSEETEVLPRISAYIMNALDVIAIYRDVASQQANIQDNYPINVPTLTIVSGLAMAAHVNGLDPTLGKSNEQNIFNFLEQFVSTFYPELAAHVTFSSPNQDAIFNNDLFRDLLAVAKEMLGHTSQKPSDASLPLNQTHPLRTAFARLERFATKRLGASNDPALASERALEYALSQFMPCVLGGTQHGGIIRSGGESERHFNAFFESFHHALHERGLADQIPIQLGIPMISRVGGNPPPYYKDSGFDPDLRQLASVAGNSLVQRIEAQGSRGINGALGDYVVLLPHPRIGFNRTLQSGWSNFQGFLQQLTAA